MVEFHRMELNASAFSIQKPDFLYMGPKVMEPCVKSLEGQQSKPRTHIYKGCSCHA